MFSNEFVLSGLGRVCLAKGLCEDLQRVGDL